MITSRPTALALSVAVAALASCVSPANPAGSEQEPSTPGKVIENLDCTLLNADLESVCSLIAAVQEGDKAISAKELSIEFLSGGKVEFHDDYGWECVNPLVGARINPDTGNYCWTLNDKYIAGADMSVAPVFRANKKWEISIDGGKSWNDVSEFSAGKNVPIIKSVTLEDDVVKVLFCDSFAVNVPYIKDVTALEVGPLSSLVFGAEAGSTQIYVNTAKAWSVSGGDPSWIRVSPAQGAGSVNPQTVDITVTALTGVADRKATLTFTNGDRTVNVEVTQLSPMVGLYIVSSTGTRGTVDASNDGVPPLSDVSINGVTYTTDSNNYVEVPRSTSFSVGYPVGMVGTVYGSYAKVFYPATVSSDETGLFFGYYANETDCDPIPNPVTVQMNPCSARLNIKTSGYDPIRYIDLLAPSGSALAADYVTMDWSWAEPAISATGPLNRVRISMSGAEEATVNVIPGSFSSLTIKLFGDDPSNPLAEKVLSSASFRRGTVTAVEMSYSPELPVDPPSPYGQLPTEGQVAWQRRELLMFYHYGQATFSGWDGENSTCNGKAWSESLLLQNYKPTTIDTDQWVKVAADNGFKEIIITAKHHDGFCLWDNPESTTDVANANCSNHTDVLAGLREACNKYGVEMGIYLSPWDRMIEAAGVSTSVYETRFKNAANDLMTKYAPVVEFWLDGNHAGNFNWSAVNQTIFDVNPQCVIFSNGGPGCRWVGNEDGVAGETNWGTLNIKGRGLSPSSLPGSYGTYLSQGDEGGDSWCAAECDFSIQQIGDHNGWFYGANDSRKTAKQLLDLYYKSVGRNGVFLMNVPPSNAGVIDSKEVAVIEEFTAMRNQIFSTDLSSGAQVSATKLRGKGFEPEKMLDGDLDTYYATPDGENTTDIEIILEGTKTFNRVMLQEYIPLGQRIEAFTVQYRRNGSWTSWQTGTTVGHKRILVGNAVTTDAVRIRITSSLAPPTVCNFGLFYDTY